MHCIQTVTQFKIAIEPTKHNSTNLIFRNFVIVIYFTCTPGREHIKMICKWQQALSKNSKFFPKRNVYHQGCLPFLLLCCRCCNIYAESNDCTVATATASSSSQETELLWTSWKHGGPDGCIEFFVIFRRLNSYRLESQLMTGFKRQRKGWIEQTLMLI